MAPRDARIVLGAIVACALVAGITGRVSWPGVIVIIVAAPFLLVRFITAANRSKERMAHHDRCAFCRARLKKMPGKASWATTCPKCAKTQPWAR